MEHKRTLVPLIFVLAILSCSQQEPYNVLYDGELSTKFTKSDSVFVPSDNECELYRVHIYFNVVGDIDSFEFKEEWSFDNINWFQRINIRGNPVLDSEYLNTVKKNDGDIKFYCSCMREGESNYMRVLVKYTGDTDDCLCTVYSNIERIEICAH